MAKPAYRWEEQTNPQAIQTVRGMAQGLTENPTYNPTPEVTAAELTAAADDLEAADLRIVALDGEMAEARTDSANKRAALEELGTLAGNDCGVKTGYDKLKLQALKVPLTNEAAAPDTSPLQNVQVSHGDHDGEVDGACNRRKGAKLYRARCGLTATGPWTIVYEGTKSKFTVTGQPLGQVCYFQMQAFVGGVWTEWSDIAQIRVL